MRHPHLFPVRDAGQGRDCAARNESAPHRDPLPPLPHGAAVHALAATVRRACAALAIAALAAPALAGGLAAPTTGKTGAMVTVGAAGTAPAATLAPVLAASAALAPGAVPGTAPGISDALLAVESHRAGIVEAVVARFGSQVEALGFTVASLREQLLSLRADQLLAASLVRDLAALDLRPIAAADPLQRYVAIEPVDLRLAAAGPAASPAASAAASAAAATLAQAAPAALAWVVRSDGVVRVVSPEQLAARRAALVRDPAGADEHLVGYFVDARAVAVLAGGGLLPKDGAGTGAQSWIGYTAGGNQASAQGSAVMAGLNNTASGAVSAVIAGNGNVASGQGALIGGGDNHRAQGVYSVIVGGYQHTASGADAVIVGGAFNENAGQRSLLGAGARNKIAAEASYAVIGGGGRDTDVGTGAAGTNDKDNVAFSQWTFIGGGMGNRAGVSGQATANQGAAVVGGQRNVASGVYSFVGGGDSNRASGGSSFVGGGFLNRASGGSSFVGGGEASIASGNYSTVGGGWGNTASGYRSTVPGGESNTASGNYSVAMGRRAKTQTSALAPDVHAGAFVFADSTDADFNSAANNTFNIRASNGMHLSPATTIRMGSQVRQNISLYGDPSIAGNSYGIGVQAAVQYFRVDSGTVGGAFAWFRGGIHSDVTNDAGSGGTVLMRLDRNGNLITAGAVNPPSDRAVKTAFAAIDPQAILAKVARLPITTWTYRNEAAAQVRHIGPTAQDFRRAFGLGAGDTTIATVDADGVALAAIQGLNAKLEMDRRTLALRSDRLEAANRELVTDNRALRERLSASEQALAAERAQRELELRELRAELRALAARR